MLKESEKLFQDINNIIVAINGVPVDLSLIKAACTECIIIKLFAEFEKTLKKEIIYKYLANDRTKALDLLNADSHKMPKSLKEFIDKITKDNIGDIECMQKMRNLDIVRNNSVAHTSALCQSIAWEELPSYIEKANIFLDQVKQYLEGN